MLHYQKTDVLQNIGKNARLRAEILDKLSDGSALGAFEDDELESLGPAAETVNTDLVNDMFNGVDVHNDIAEAIVLFHGRPVIRIKDNDIVFGDFESDEYTDLFTTHRPMVQSIVTSVGRIDLDGHRRLPWVGTGWIIDDDIIATNRHVAREFSIFNGSTFDFLPGLFGDQIVADIDFRHEHEVAKKESFRIKEVLFIEPEGGPDLAFIRVDWSSGQGGSRSKLELWDQDIDTSRDVAVIGYPAKDTRTDRPKKMDEIFGSIYNVKRMAPGLVVDVAKDRGLLVHDCTTLGGNSGSAVFDVATGKAIALHFAGREEEANFAVLSSVVDARLKQVKSNQAISALGGIRNNNEVIEEKPTIDAMADRTGYDPDFLDIRVELPEMSDEVFETLAPVEDDDFGELKYTHYSVFMNTERRIATYAVVNIDGNQLHGIPRATDKWYLDPRIELEHQVGNELYKSNPLDRGHLVRRLDPAWGSTRSVAELAVEDSFFYTNAAPQHLGLNRKIWLGLEDHILNNAGKFDLKVTVFTGPVFDENDQEHRGIQIPNEFWKIVAIVKPDDEEEAGTLSATGYMLSQSSLIEDLEFVFGEHQGFQVRIDLIEELTGLDFGDLREADPLARLSEEESVGAGFSPKGRRLTTLNDIVL